MLFACCLPAGLSPFFISSPRRRKAASSRWSVCQSDHHTYTTLGIVRGKLPQVADVHHTLLHGHIATVPPISWQSWWGLMSTDVHCRSLQDINHSTSRQGAGQLSGYFYDILAGMNDADLTDISGICVPSATSYSGRRQTLTSDAAETEEAW